MGSAQVKQDVGGDDHPPGSEHPEDPGHILHISPERALSFAVLDHPLAEITRCEICATRFALLAHRAACARYREEPSAPEREREQAMDVRRLLGGSGRVEPSGWPAVRAAPAESALARTTCKEIRVVDVENV